MSVAYTGGCACAAEPVVTNDCQCRDCQRESGAGHGSHLTFPRSGVTLAGEAARWDMVGDSGAVKTRAFCPTCGSPVFMTLRPWQIFSSVRAASLDDPGRYKPQMVTYGGRGHAWDHVDPALPEFDGMPPT